MAVDQWNHNVHYYPLVLDEVPEGCAEALDVGCGDGRLARELAGRAQRVTGIDRDPGMIGAARERADSPGLSFVEADFLEFHDESRAAGYDFISSVAAIHHMEFAAAVGSMVRLLAPGGRLVIVGLARNRTPLDWAAALAGLPAHQVRARRHGGCGDAPGMPVRDPDMSWGQVRRAAEHLLPGSRFRRHLLWRYSLTWQKPG
ncbi:MULTISPECIES: bifunctional 2-polyprenyl-6-hydroxyphenol methylase/3-demethylubiquinol 3-O-methyltransferase UbiG [unclassified Saccharopolyspora]|uniref:class I SAM-dependent methyltransferase n=2 Tax=Pseudonocardiaceae TaxID=2070 RepID=UPI00190D43FF|nr:class I SAM-dependent methyltransferase [Saccharopolyspora sp. HNM0986]MBK0868159.1 class I SAM-dependent methyltransferase [Saccharopolyspora sp. HNM0986]